MDNIFATIRKERRDFLQNEITIVGGYTFSQYNTVKKVHLYHSSHYEKGDYEVINGVQRKKVFYNINSWRCEVATKMLDIDVKDFLLLANSPDQDINVMLLEKELKVWMKKHKFGRVLNEVVNELPIYGTVVLKKFGNNDVELVDLRYLYNDQSAASLKDATYIILRHLVDRDYLRKMRTKWNNVDAVLEKFDTYSATVGYDNLNDFGGTNVAFTQANNQNLLELFERYGYFPKSWITKKDSDAKEYVWGKFIVTGVDSVVRNDNGVIVGEDGTVLWAEELDKEKDFPFKEVHYRRIKGRWLGEGVVEMTFEAQRRINEIKNQEAKALELAAIQVFQTRSTNVQDNILTDIDTGDIIQSDSEITPIATESRNLVGFQDAFASYDQLADRQTFSYDIVRGEQSPASATLGAVQLQAQQASSVFDYKRENISLFLSEYVTDLVIPGLQKELNKEHVFRLTGSMEELNKIRMNVAKHAAHQRLIDYILSPEFVKADTENISPEMEQAFIAEEMRKLEADGDKVWVSVMKDFFKNADYHLDLVISGENRNIFSQVGNAQSVLMALQDPTITQDPAKRAVFFKMLSGLGMHVSEIQDIESKVQSEQQMLSQLPQAPELTNPLTQTA